MKIEDLRNKIDGIDIELLGLMNERARLAEKIGEIKKKKKLKIYDPHRESELVNKLLAENAGPLPGEDVRGIFREIISACLALQEPLRIAYFGPEATFTHLAAMEKFGGGAEYNPVKSIGDVFLEVEKGRSGFGVVPVENSIEGMVSHTLDMFADSELKICSEIMLPVSHHLLSRSPLDEIKTVYSHPQAFAQCRAWLESNIPGCELRDAASTAAAARLAASEASAAAIASRAASELYSLPVAAADIEDASSNLTRFLVISRDEAPGTGNDKTSVMFSIKDRIGALYDMLKSFKKHDINLTKIESRPSKKKAWDYFFFVDMKGHAEDENVAAALAELEKECVFFKVLGSYPEAEKK